MSNLLELQKVFADDLLQDSNHLTHYIQSTDDLPSANRIEIYRGSMIASLQKSLIETYEVCYKLVGEEFFIYLANEFIFNHHSYSPDLNDYGSQFPLFIENHAKNPLLYLADVARLEWAYQCAFNSSDVKDPNFETLKTLDDSIADQVLFLLPPGSTLLTSSYPLLQIWSMNQCDVSNDKLTLPENKIFYYFIWRNKLEVCIEELQKNEWDLLNLINQKVSLGKMSKIIPEQELLTLLANFTHNQWLCDFTIGRQDDF